MLIEILTFMGKHYVLGFFMIASLYYLIHAAVVVLPNRIMRHANIRKHGYPPAHCDADGDFLKPSEDD